MAKPMELYDYQKEYIKDFPKSGIMTADVGLGKTAMALKHFDKHNKDKDRALVVVAPASKIRSGDWDRDVAEWTTGMTKGLNYLSLSYERFTKEMDDADFEPEEWERTTFIFDEVHYCKNPTTKRGKLFAKTAQKAYQWIGLTATPMSNGWHDAANYAIATKIVKNKTQFYRLFVVQMMKRMGNRQFPMITGYQNVHALQAWWGKIAKPLSREGNLSLPQFIDKWITIQVPAEVMQEQKRLINERTEKKTGEMLDSHPKLIAALRRNLVKVREDSLRNILDKTDENIVIFYELNAERDMVLNVLKDKEYANRTLFEQNGHVKTLPPADALKPSKNAVLLIQYRSGSAGLNLQYASVTIFLSPTYSYQDYHQARGRTDRNGQTKTPVFYHLRVLSKIDIRVWEALQNKRDFSEKTVDINDLDG